MFLLSVECYFFIIMSIPGMKNHSYIREIWILRAYNKCSQYLLFKKRMTFEAYIILWVLIFNKIFKFWTNTCTIITVKNL